MQPVIPPEKLLSSIIEIRQGQEIRHKVFAQLGMIQTMFGETVDLVIDIRTGLELINLTVSRKLMCKPFALLRRNKEIEILYNRTDWSPGQIGNTTGQTVGNVITQGPIRILAVIRRAAPLPGGCSGCARPAQRGRRPAAR